MGCDASAARMDIRTNGLFVSYARTFTHFTDIDTVM